MRRWFVPLLLAINAALAAGLLILSARNSSLQRELHAARPAAGKGDAPAPAAPAVRPRGRPSGVRAAGLGRMPAPVAADEPLAVDLESELARHTMAAMSDEDQARRMREVFERYFPRAEELHRRGDRAQLDALWKDYCAELADTLAPPQLERLGCTRHEPPARADLEVPHLPPRPDPPALSPGRPE